MASIEMRAVRKLYGRTEAIRGIDLAVSDGEFLVLLGPSGCGKSTLLRMVAGLEAITAGEIVIADRVVNGLEPKDRNIAMVFQNYALYPHMSVYENMAYGLKIRGVPKAEIDAAVRAAAETLELSPYLDRRPRQLSGGQRQRVAMGRAIVRRPAAFLFDEPLSNLDAKLRTQMRVEIKRLQARLGVTSLYVTHDQVEAMTLADRILVMNEGRAEQVGTPIDVYRHPASTFVAGFIGAPAMNLIPARIAGDCGGIELAGARLPLNGSVPLSGADAGRPVLAGIRPEHLSPVASGSDGAMALAVDLVEALGADTVIHGRLGNGDGVSARLPGIARVRAGEPLHLSCPPDAIHLFAPETGLSLTPRA